MASLEKRIIKIIHNTAYRIAEMYKIVSEAQRKVDTILKKVLLDVQEVEDLKNDKNTGN